MRQTYRQDKRDREMKKEHTRINWEDQKIRGSDEEEEDEESEEEEGEAMLMNFLSSASASASACHS